MGNDDRVSNLGRGPKPNATRFFVERLWRNRRLAESSLSSVNESQSCESPLLASPRGGVAASSIKFREATEADAAGVVFLVFSRLTRCTVLRLHLAPFIGTPPLLAAMRGGDSRTIAIHSHLDRDDPYSKAVNFFTAPLPRSTKPCGIRR